VDPLPQAAAIQLPRVQDPGFVGAKNRGGPSGRGEWLPMRLAIDPQRFALVSQRSFFDVLKFTYFVEPTGL